MWQTSFCETLGYLETGFRRVIINNSNSGVTPMGSGWANPRAPWLRGHPSLHITALSKLGCAWNKPTRGIYSTLSHRHPRAPWHKVTPLNSNTSTRRCNYIITHSFSSCTCLCIQMDGAIIVFDSIHLCDLTF